MNNQCLKCEHFICDSRKDEEVCKEFLETNDGQKIKELLEKIMSGEIKI